MIKVFNVSVSYSSTPIIENISFQIEPNDMVAILGMNGAGKTTLLKAILNLIPFQGEIRIDGNPIENFRAKEFAKKISYLSQVQNLPFDLSVKEFLSFGRYPHLSQFADLSQTDYDLIDHFSEMTAIENLYHRQLNELSGGERQRVLLTKCLIQDTQIVLLDEPISFLDLKQQFEILDLIRSINETSNKTILSVMHDISFADEYFKKALIIHDRKLLAFGSTKDIINANNLKTTFGVDAKILEYENEKRLFIFKNSSSY